MHIKSVRASLALLFLFSLSLVTSAQAQNAQPDDAQILHLLNRTSFGPAPGDIERVRTIGINAYIEEQLHPSKILIPPLLQARIDELPTTMTSIPALSMQFALPPNIKDLPEEQAKELRKKQNIVVAELIKAKILRAVLSPAQLQEVMTDFWFNHFNVFAEKGTDRIMISSYERDAIRPYALGKFGDLLRATAYHPAMLFYLDNWLNTDPNSIAARGKKVGINENYAREIMELHTLGVNGGYTQADVTTLAHILTGWGLNEGKEQQYPRTMFMFDPKRHDYTNFVWLGYNVPGGGEEEIERVLDALAHHPSTAHHISYELAQYFVADEPPPQLVDKMAATFHSSNGDIATVLRTMFQSPDFWDPHNMHQKFKPPFRYVVSTLRVSGLTPPEDMGMLQGAIGQMGEPLYRCLTPNGYSNTNDQWLNSDALLKRIDYAKKLTGKVPSDLSGSILEALGKDWSASTLNTAGSADPRLKAALLLSSPEFVYY